MCHVALFLILFLASTISCAARDSYDGLPCDERCDDFAQSLTREPTDSEKVGLIRLPDCSGSSVQNAGGRSLVLTANHCFPEGPETWCDGGEAIHEATGNVLSCKEVLISNELFDSVLLEFDNTEDIGGLRLPDYQLLAGTRLAVFGYPLPWGVTGEPVATVAENCWVTAERTEKQPSLEGRRDVFLGHNCDIHPGNSGGLLRIEGTDVAGAMVSLGTRIQSGDLQGYGVDLAVFVERHREVLDDLEVSLVRDGEALLGTPEDYLASGIYTSPDGCDLLLDRVGMSESFLAVTDTCSGKSDESMLLQGDTGYGTHFRILDVNGPTFTLLERSTGEELRYHWDRQFLEE